MRKRSDTGEKRSGNAKEREKEKKKEKWEVREVQKLSIYALKREKDR